MKKVVASILGTICLASMGTAAETYKFNSRLQVSICAPGVPSTECELVDQSRTPIPITVTLADTGSKDPQIFTGTWSQQVLRNSVPYDIDLVVSRISYGGQSEFEIYSTIGGDGWAKKALLNVHKMDDFRGRLDVFGEIYKVGQTRYIPFFQVAPEGWTLKNLFHIPFLANLMGSY